MSDPLLPFVHPSGVVVVGASTSPDKLGYGVARNLIHSGFRGAIHLIAQKPGEVFGRQIHASLTEVADPVDLAVIVVPAPAVPGALDACGARGIRAAIITSAGFREVGPVGADLEQQCVVIARANGIRLLGPNCIGTVDTHFPLDTSFLQPPMPPAGSIAFVSHSGAFCAAVIDWSRRQGFGFSQIVSVGNQADLTETDVLPLVAADEHTRVIALYMEGVSKGLEFVQTAKGVSFRKPVVALKVGRSDAGRKAAASHTAAMAGSDVAFSAAFEKCGILRASSAEQMFDWARALETCPLPSGRRVAILTDAGGPGVIAADALDTEGLAMADLSAVTRGNLASRLPPAASVANPVDMLASASPEDYAACLQALLEDASVDSVVVILPPPPMFTAAAVAGKIIPVIHQSTKPVLVALLGSELTAPAFSLFAEAKVPAYPFPERAVSALGAIARRARWLSAISRDDQRPFPIDTQVGSGAPPDSLLAAYGIRTAPLDLAHSKHEAAMIAKARGFPVVMKVASADIVHKSDVDGVRLDIKDEAGAESAYTQLMTTVAARAPNAKLDGVYVQRQMSGGQEVIVGATRDPNFGPLIMFGTGGIEAEGLHDVAFALAPLSPTEAGDLINRTWAGRRLDGFRNRPAVDRSAASEVLVRLSWLAFDHPEIREIEINPLCVLREGAYAVDVRWHL
jgi:acetate---CoA ligase (ADP-forming)